MSTINGLPAHVFLVHAVVALVPLSAVLLLLIAFWPAARQRLSVPAAVLSAVTVGFVPLTTSAGSWLAHHLERTALLRAHTHLGDTMLPWAIGVFVVTAAVAAREIMRARRTPSTTAGVGGRGATIVLAVLALVVAVGSTTTIYRIGDSGAKAAWTGKFSPTDLPQPPRQPSAIG
jgi:hypothetical protein